MKRILLIEDDSDFAVIFIRKLVSHFEVHWATSARMARNLYKAAPGRFELIVSDCMGVEMTGALPDLSFAPAHRIIMISSTVAPIRANFKFVAKQDICEYLINYDPLSPI